MEENLQFPTVEQFMTTLKQQWAKVDDEGETFGYELALNSYVNMGCRGHFAFDVSRGAEKYLISSTITSYPGQYNVQTMVYSLRWLPAGYYVTDLMETSYLSDDGYEDVSTTPLEVLCTKITLQIYSLLRFLNIRMVNQGVQ